MAELMQIRQRIGAIETIKKITHAMRLISMSNHTRLKAQEPTLSSYTKRLTNLFHRTRLQAPQWYSSFLQPTSSPEGTKLIILIGSDKGLCGNFNTTLFYFFDEYLSTSNQVNTIYIAVGKKAIDYLEQKKKIFPFLVFKQFTANTFLSIAHAIMDHIMLKSLPYQSVTIFSNVLKTFFLQKPEKTILIPFESIDETREEQHSIIPDFYWEQNPQEVIDYLARQIITGTLEYLLFQSLIAEQASRFISMDSSTRNADRLLDHTKQLYNKLRQATITKELAELTGSF